MPAATPRSDAPCGRVAGRVAVVTGAGGGIGRSIAIRLAAEGASIAALDIDEDGVGETVAQISAAGGCGIARVGDVTDEATVQTLVANVVESLGPVDILVNNVGGGRSGRIWDATLTDWDAVIRLNLRSTFLCTREVVPGMIARRSGRIIAMSSGAREGTPWTAYYSGNSAYATAKAGIHGFIRNVALELAEHGITVNAVAPGPIRTERLDEVFKSMEGLDYGPQRMVPMRRLGEPMDIAHAVLFLASDEAGYITGITLSVAGGR